MENPDPEKYEPVIIRGIKELKERFELQSENAIKLNNFIEDIKSTINIVESTLNQTTNRINELKQKQEKLTIKLLNIIGKIEVLRCRNVPLRTSEIQ